jgi:excisionase family DNA binding protein
MAYLRISKQTLYRWVQEGRLIAYELPSGRGRRLKREDLDQLMTPSGVRDVLVAKGIAQASTLGHEMEHVISSDNTAFYQCQDCGESFTVGFPDSAGRREARSPMQLLSATVLRTPCSGRPLGSSKYFGDVIVIPPNDPSSQPVIKILQELGVAAWALRERPEQDNYHSLCFPLEVWARNYDEAKDRLVKRAKRAIARALQGSELQPAAVRVEVAPDSVHGPSLG